LVAFFEDLLDSALLLRKLEKWNQACLECLSTLYILDEQLCQVYYREMPEKLQATLLINIGLGFE